jgi:signal transduction histidine kinase
MTKKFKSQSLGFKIIITITLILIVSLASVFYTIGKRYEGLLYSQLHSQAKILFNHILLTRRWLADQDGLYVKRFKGMNHNEFIPKSSITDTKGQEYILKNPARVTREISEYSKQEGTFWYHITSLKLINPKNAPDDFERLALNRFEKERGLKELNTIKYINGQRYYIYIAPLLVEGGCLKCHAAQGYKIGDIRGALTISLNAEEIYKQIEHNKWLTLILSFFITIIIILSLSFTMTKLVIRPVRTLTSSIKDYSKNKTYSVKLVGSGDEIADLSKSFLEMVYELQIYHNQLDQKVKEATLNLEDKNCELQELNERLKDLNIKKSDFIASISHEMRTPLTSIIGAMDYIFIKITDMKVIDDNSQKGIDEIAEFFVIIKNNANRLSRIVNDTIDLERIEMGMFDMVNKEIDLKYVIDDVVSGLMAIFDKKSIQVKVQTEYSLNILIDEDRIRQVLVNLLNNAVNFSPIKGIIVVNSYKKDGYVITEIVDEGPGIDDAEIENLFKKYYKKGNHHGSGLGLAICKGIITTAKGTIGVSQGKGKGSIFYFTIPSYSVLHKQ